MKRMRYLLALLLAFSLVAAACGDDDDDAGSGDSGDGGGEMVTGPGVDVENKVIRVGLNADLSGTFAALTSVIVEGQVVFWDAYNDAGGYKGWTVEPAAVNGDATATLQQPSDHRAGPDRDAAVVKEAQLHRPWQRLEQGGRLSGNAIPEQIRQHQWIPGAGMAERDQ